MGAGPGDPDLITLRGAAALRDADAVVYDALASPELLELASPEAERINVGKRGHEEITRSQDDINALLVRLAREGKKVVRLKGGDPFVFGRGGEEATACVEAGVEFEVIPGISSVIGALAYAGIPITDRRHSASFSVVTGHKDPTRVSKETRWKELATASDTLVILMGMRNLESIVERLLGGGCPASKPAAAVMNGTLPNQQVVIAPLAELVEKVRAAKLGAPSAVVVGNVVRLRDSLAWFEKRSLFGSRVLVTRAADQSGEIARALRELGAEAVLIPMIRLAPPADASEIDAALGQLAGYDALLFTSANAVRFFSARAAEIGLSSFEAAPPTACVGPITADAARRAGFSVELVPDDRRDAVGLLEAVSKHWPPRGRRFLLPQAEAARPALAEGLREAGAAVDAVTVYQTVAAEVDAEALREQLCARRLDALTFTSPSTAENFAALLDEESLRAAADCTIAAIGSVTADALRRLGLEPDVVPDEPTMQRLAEGLAARMGRAPEGEER
ncbi:MAG: uroporphyrinogen-III C-methyltransferase [Deltaproteobacteria bacterium]|nr:uroporphyrinogen-III C-methyltransferase [Deltaproteobacteria bacterium]